MIEAIEWEKSGEHLCVIISGAQDINTFLDKYQGKHSVEKLHEPNATGLTYNLIFGKDYDFEYGLLDALSEAVFGQKSGPAIRIWVERNSMDFWMFGNVLGDFVYRGEAPFKSEPMKEKFKSIRREVSLKLRKETLEKKNREVWSGRRLISSDL